MTNVLVDLSDRSKGKPIRAGFFPGRSVEGGYFPLPESVITKLQDAGWQIVQNNEKGLLLTYGAFETPIRQKVLHY